MNLNQDDYRIQSLQNIAIDSRAAVSMVYAMVQVHNGTGTQWYRYTMVQIHNGTDTQRYMYTMVQMHNGTVTLTCQEIIPQYELQL